MLAASPIAPMLPVVDLDRARRFYEDTLGLPLVEDLSGPDTLVFECGQGTLLGVYMRPTPTRADHTEAAFQVDDLENAIRTLGSRGVVFEHYDMPGLKTDRQGIADMNGSRGAWFKDPEGNILGLFQMM
jgi:predicted enzyme related to lactoylglutathione lyase